jgi:molybdopterin-guanine dinucleotide biosynthesis protein A
MIGETFSMIVLAGGASSRMGRDKSDLLLGNRTFLETQIRKGIQLGIKDILVSGYRGEKKKCKNHPGSFYRQRTLRRFGKLSEGGRE